MMRKILLPLIILLLFAGSMLYRGGPATTHGQSESGRPARTANVKSRPPAPRTVRDELPLEERKELAEDFRSAYNLAETPDLTIVNAIVLNNVNYGVVAKGVVVREKLGELYLDTTPCVPELHKKQVYAFNYPYKKEKADDIECPKTSVKYKLVKVIQRDKRRLAR